MTTKIKIKKLNSSAKLPEKKSQGAAAWDLYSSEFRVIPKKKVGLVSTGLAMEIPFGWKGEIYSRSGLASKGIWVANQPGKIDSDYRGEIKVILYNNTHNDFFVNAGDRIAQFEVNEVNNITWEKTENLSVTKRSNKGFGSTG